MKTNFNLLAVLASLTVSSLAFAQSSNFPPPAQGGLQALRHSSTLQEGILRGRADLFRGVGEYNYNTAAAALIFEDARKANYDNQLKHAETFWAKKQLYESIQASRKPQRQPAVQSNELRPAAIRLPAPPINLNQAGFVWPEALRRAEFAPLRDQLTSLFAQRTPTNSGVQSENFSAIRDTMQQTRATLNQIVRQIEGAQFVEAKQFLDRLAIEASQPLPVNQVAAN